MSFAQLFSLANTAALLGWACLILAPRHHLVIGALRYGLIAALAVTYTVLILLFFFQVQGGGFNSIEQVRALFLSDGGLVAGWVHYLAFDLFIGIWIAEEADWAGTSRLVQAPILVATFMFGPVGLLLHYATRAAQMKFPLKRGA